MLLTRKDGGDPPTLPFGGPTPSGNTRLRVCLDVALPIALFVGALAWNLWFAAGASAQGVITGEEASIDHRDPLALSLGWQPSIWSTNAGSQLYYLLMSHLTPDYGLLWARPVKAATMAVLPALLYVVARRRLGCSPIPAAIGAATTVLLPGVSAVSWIGTENGFEALWGVLALYLATSRRAWWPVALLPAAYAVSNYTAGLAWAAVVVLVCLWRIRSVRDVLLVLLAGAVGTGGVLAPVLWWRNGGIVVTGGGRSGADLDDWQVRLADIAHLLVVDGSSYYWFSGQPMLVSQTVAGVLAVGALLALVRRFAAVWPWFAVALSSTALYLVSSGVPGARRVVAVAVVGGLLLAPAADELMHLIGRTPRTVGAPLMGIAIIATAVVVVVPSIQGASATRAELASGARALPVDWPFPIDPGGTQATTLDRLDADLRAGSTTPTEVGDAYGGTRTLAMLIVLSTRDGRTPPLSSDDLLVYYRSTADCEQLDGPALCR